MKEFFWSVFMLGLLASSCATPAAAPKDEVQGCDLDGAHCRPFRTGMIKFEPDLDAQKPLGTIDEAGWTLANQTIIGSFKDRWVTGFDLKRKQHIWWLETKADLTAPVEVFGSFGIVALRDGRLLKIDVTTGKVIWENHLTQFVATKVVLSGTSLLAYTVDQKLYSIDFQAGQTLWAYDAASSPNLLIRTGAAPQVVGNEVFIGSVEGDIRSIHIASGKENWRLRPGKDDFRFKDIVGEIGVGTNQIYATRYDGLIFGIDIQAKPNGTLWEVTAPSITTSAYRDGTMYIGSMNGELLAIQASNGRQLWKAKLGQSIKSLTVGEKAIFVGGSQGRISAVALSGGQLLWHDDLGGNVTKQPFVLDDEIYFSTGLKVIYSYKIL
ncbi:MAG: PQQ-binding-like beta-propeller repeat protein [Chitinophagaceae bacterium]|nr:PQQ-binding-like beta-propeller repeat protein [Oligoflexus sp.]